MPVRCGQMDRFNSMKNGTPKDPAPLIEQLGEALRKQIRAGKLGRNGQLPSVRELAAQYRVSKSTVANAIAQLKEQGLLHTARKRGVYLANGKHATHPQPVHTGTIGVYARGTNDILRERVYFDAFNGIRKAAEEHGHTVLYLGNDSNDESRPLSLPLGIRDIDGLVYIVTSVPNRKFLREMKRRSMPLVMMDSAAPEFKIDSVLIDNVSGSKHSVQRLIDCGHRRIAFLNSTHGQSAAERLAGYREALAAAGIAFDPKLVTNSLPTVESGRDAMQRVLKQQQQPMAAFAFSDFHALGAILAVETAGLSVPNDFSVASFGNEAGAFADAMGKRLATTDVNMVEMGRASTEQLLNRIGGFAGPPQTVRMKCGWIEGNTIASPATHSKSVTRVKKSGGSLV